MRAQRAIRCRVTPRRTVPNPVQSSLVTLCSLLLLYALPACSQTIGFTRHVWGVSDGIPEPIVQVLGQDHDGFLLVGTSGGLTRFDGARFAPVLPEGSRESLPFPIYCLIVARDGSVWAGTEGEGLIHFEGKRITRYNGETGLSDPFVRGLIQDAKGRIWAGTDNGLFVSNGPRFERVDDTLFTTPLAVAAIAMDDHQRIWAGGSDLVVVDGNHLQRVKLPGAYSNNRVKSLLQANDGTFWVGTVGGLLKRTGGQFNTIPGISATVRSLTQTHDGTIWIGTIGQGIWNEHGGVLKRLDRSGMLPSETVLAIFEDPNWRMWIGTQNGLVRLEATSVQVVPLPNGTEADYGTISEASDSNSWMVVGRLFRVNTHKAERVVESGVPEDGLRSVFQARDGSVWVGTDGGGAYHCEASGHIVHLLAPRELPNNFIRVFREGLDGSVWIGTDQGIARVAPHGVIEKYTVANGLSQFSIRDLLADRNGNVWIGTDKGLSHWRRNAMVHDEVTAASRNEKVWSILEDRQGTLWFATRDHGLYRYRDGMVLRYTVSQGLTSNTMEPLATTRYQMPYEADGAQLYGGRQSSRMASRSPPRKRSRFQRKRLVLSLATHLSTLARNGEFAFATCWKDLTTIGLKQSQRIWPAIPICHRATFGSASLRLTQRIRN